MSENPFETQVGGGHYTKCKIQPFQYSLANGLGPAEHTVVKYVTRWRDKGGLKDLEKAKHVIDLLIAFETEKLKEDTEAPPASNVPTWPVKPGMVWSEMNQRWEPSDRT